MKENIGINSFEDRLGIVAGFYNLPLSAVEAAARLPMGNDRRKECSRLGISLSVLRTMADYNRYSEARQVESQLFLVRQAIVGLRTLDFGCLVADYGMYFALRGAAVTLYDVEEHLQFALHRFSQSGYCVETFTVPTPMDKLMRGMDLVIFGEVLEHLDDPMGPLQACVSEGVRYIFTSCFPFGGDRYFKLPGHSRKAQALQPQCASVLSRHYTGCRTHGKAVFWTHRSLAAASS